ncbi:glycoside hydrolase [Serendipita vermifera]|nr:glycoside hydrolase [Serendipita vermifera]
MSFLRRALSLSTALMAIYAVNAGTIQPNLVERADDKNVIVQMFEWTWDAIAAECTSFLGPAGYGYVQVSPPSEHIQGSQWWTDYQIVSYILTSKRGNRNQFSNMVSTCHNAGVKILVDAVLNHMTGTDSGTGTAGSSFTHYNYPGIYQTQDFHHCGLTSNDDIADYTSRAQVQTCELSNLADLTTDTDYVRGKLASYLTDLKSLGVDGFRLDAAKHMPTADIANILSRVSSPGYISQEVIWGSGEPIQPSEYVANGQVQEFRYTTALKDAFSGGGISGLQNLESRGWVAGSSANVFVANHDTERNGNSLSYKSSNNIYTLAMVFSLAHSYGTPTILSSYTFSSNDAGSPGGGSCSGSGGANGWQCQHRWNAVAGLVGFHNTVGSSAITNWYSTGSQQIAFGRGSSGFVVINNSDGSWSSSFTTSLPDGTYCDVYTGPKSGTSCSGASYTVSGGVFSATVAARSAVALHTGATGGTGSSSSVTVTFSVYATTTWGQNIYVAGNITQLGNWTPASGLALSSASYPTWKGSVTIPSGTKFSYKYTKVQDSTVTWESDPNRSYTVGTTSVTLNDTWR